MKYREKEWLEEQIKIHGANGRQIALANNYSPITVQRYMKKFNLYEKKEIKKQPIEEDSDIIIFDDDTDITPTPKNHKKENGQKKDKTKKDDNFDLEDEYYDLDGF